MAFAFIFLGSGTSQGVPLIGKDYPPEFLANPKNHRTRPSIYVATDQVKFVVDTTPEFRMQCCAKTSAGWTRWCSRMRTPTTSWGWTIAGDFAICAAAALPIYANEETMAALQAGLSFMPLTSGRLPKGYFHPEPHIMDGPFTLGDLEITPLPLPHGSLTTNGYLFLQNGKKRLAYLSDCKEIPPDATGKSPGRGSRRAGRAALHAASDAHVPGRGADGGAADRRGADVFHPSDARLRPRPGAGGTADPA